MRKVFLGICALMMCCTFTALTGKAFGAAGDYQDARVQIQNITAEGNTSIVIPAAWQNPFQWDYATADISSASVTSSSSSELRLRLRLATALANGLLQTLYVDAFGWQIPSDVLTIRHGVSTMIHAHKRPWNKIRFVDQYNNPYQPISVHWSNTSAVNSSNQCPGNYYDGFLFPLYDQNDLNSGFRVWVKHAGGVTGYTLPPDGATFYNSYTASPPNTATRSIPTMELAKKGKKITKAGSLPSELKALEPESEKLEPAPKAENSSERKNSTSKSRKTENRRESRERRR